MSLLSPQDWQNYRDTIKDAHDTFNQDTISWFRYDYGVDRWGEGSEDEYTEIILSCLFNYNFYQTWPVNETTQTGEKDEQVTAVYFNKDYLNEQGYLDPNGNLPINLGKDYFIHRGIKYFPKGDTFAGQAFDDPLHVFIVLQRADIPTGTDRTNQ